MKKILLFAVMAALVLASSAAAASPPPQMVGKWTRLVTAADVAKAGATKVIAGRTWTLSITQRGTVASLAGTTMKGQIIPSSATQVNIEIGQQKPNLYDWRRVGTKLILHARVESNNDRKAVLQGTWVKRSG